MRTLMGAATALLAGLALAAPAAAQSPACNGDLGRSLRRRPAPGQFETYRGLIAELGARPETRVRGCRAVLIRAFGTKAWLGLTRLRRPGRYRITARAVDRAGLKGRPSRVLVVRRR